MGMTRQEQLDAVVRNYGEWEPGEGLNRAAWHPDTKKVYFFNYPGFKGDKIGESYLFTLLEVEQRKAELQNKPSWDDAPTGAKILVYLPWASRWVFASYSDARAKDNDRLGLGKGDWFGIGSGKWFLDDGVVQGEVVGDWRDTLEKRPESEKDETLKAINASKEKAVVDLLEERGERYGDFETLAEAVENMTAALYALPGMKNSTPAHREAAHMIIQKLCRAFNGDPHYADNWVDIAGYAKLGEMSCTGKSQP